MFLETSILSRSGNPLLSSLLCYVFCYCVSYVCEDTQQLESVHWCVTCFVIVQVMCARTLCNWKVCIGVLLVCYCVSYVCEDTL